MSVCVRGEGHPALQSFPLMGRGKGHIIGTKIERTREKREKRNKTASKKSKKRGDGPLLLLIHFSDTAKIMTVILADRGKRG